MQTPPFTASHVPLTATRFDLDAYTAHAEGGPLPLDVLVPVTVLSGHAVRGRLDNWSLEGRQARIDPFQPQHIAGAVVRISLGRTSPIAFIDPACRRIQTVSGTIYALGNPHPDFRRDAPATLRYMGF